MRSFRRFGLSLAAVMGLAGAAQATIYSWSFNPAAHTHNNSAGQILAVETSFDDASDVLTWSATFGAVPNSGLTTNGFTLALTNGPNPKGQDGELALIYFDASTATVKLTAYAYNGVNSQTSHSDGSGAAGTQTPDRIVSSLGAEAGSVLALSATNNGDGTRTLAFSLDTTTLNGHSPLHAGSDPWTGAQYADHIGIWFHPVAGLASTYNANGFLSSWSAPRQGWLDLSNDSTTETPEPASLALLMLGLPGLLLRRR